MPSQPYLHQHTIVFIQLLAPNSKATYAHSVYIHNGRIAAISMLYLCTMDKFIYENWENSSSDGLFSDEDPELGQLRRLIYLTMTSSNKCLGIYVVGSFPNSHYADSYLVTHTVYMVTQKPSE